MDEVKQLHLFLDPEDFSFLIQKASSVPKIVEEPPKELLWFKAKKKKKESYGKKKKNLNTQK